MDVFTSYNTPQATYMSEKHMLHLIVLCFQSLHIVFLTWRCQETNSELCFIQYSVSSEFLGEPSDICAAESLQSLCDLKPFTSKA